MKEKDRDKDNGWKDEVCWSAAYDADDEERVAYLGIALGRLREQGYSLAQAGKMIRAELRRVKRDL